MDVRIHGGHADNLGIRVGVAGRYLSASLKFRRDIEDACNLSGHLDCFGVLERECRPAAECALYHAGAAVAGNYLVTLRRAAGALLEVAGAPPEALEPLMRRVIENGFALTGPIDRGDWATVDRHLDAIRREAAWLEPAYTALADLTAAQAGIAREVPV